MVVLRFGMWKECFLCSVILFPDLKKYTKRTQGRNHFYLIWKSYCFCDSKLFPFLFHIFFSFLSFSAQFSSIFLSYIVLVLFFLLCINRSIWFFFCRQYMLVLHSEYRELGRPFSQAELQELISR